MNKHQEALDELFAFAIYDDKMNLSVSEDTVQCLQRDKDKLQELINRTIPVEVKGKIDRWQIASFGNYSMGTQNDFVVVGLFQGQPYRTSPVQKIEDGKVYTQNSVYELGVPLQGVFKCQQLLMEVIELKKPQPIPTVKEFR